MEGEPRLLDVALFAARAHANQRRKGAAQEPYINHLLEVAQLVAEAEPGDHELVAAALLHDVIEDCGLNRANLAERFGERVAAIVAACSDDMSLSKEERRQRRMEHAAAMGREARIVKTADLISNLIGMERSPPAGWPVAWRLGYVANARALHDRVKGASPQLDERFSAQAERTEQALHAAEVDTPSGNTVHADAALDPAAGQRVHLIYLANTEAAAMGQAERERLAAILAESFPSVTLQDAHGLYEGRLRPILLVRLRSDTTEAVVVAAQRLCVAFRQRFVGIEIEGRYLRVYADDTA